ncbi:Alcohol dehydrogenase [Phytophthora palmivora]|uniref:Alcohol dehydrogenase n=1 Tax=Phytophthora palmivora TaxID=4796 RepID=A0A2P4YUK2_9STRA|nr:Alcohol dehydrogenase [Phytophthora palmivora]
MNRRERGENDGFLTDAWNGTAEVVTHAAYPDKLNGVKYTLGALKGAGGGLDHLLCQYTRAMDIRVIAIESGNDKRKPVASYGNKDFIDFKEDYVQMFEATEDPSARATVVGASGEAHKDALSFLRPHATSSGSLTSCLMLD